MKRQIWLAGIGLVLAGQALAQTPPAPVVGVVTAREQPVYSQQSYVGRIEAPEIVQLQARVTGFLEQQDFADGDMVRKGQLLYVIEQAPYQAAVDQAQAALAQAQAQSDNADVTLKRAQALLRTPAGQQSTVDSAKAAALSDSAQIAAAKAQLQTAQINYAYTQIRAPIDGQIGATAVNAGNVVGPTSGTLATIVSVDPMYVSFSLPVVDALQFRQTMTSAGLGALQLLVQLPDGRIYGPRGAIDFVNNQISQNTDTITWRGTIANPVIAGNARELTSGEFVTVILRKVAPEQQLIIPRAVRQNVVMGADTNDSVQIVSGLAAGDVIVVDGIQRIHPGIVVNPQAARS